MQTNDAMIATFADHEAAEAAVKKLAQASFDMKQLSIVGKGFHSEERVIGFYNIGDRMKFWGTQGAFWGGLWGLFLGGVFITAPAVGPVIVLGYLASSIIAAMEGAVVAGSISALAGALVSIGVPKDSVVGYETVVKQDGFLIMAHGSAEDMKRAKAILGTANASRIDVHPGIGMPNPVLVPVPVLANGA
jgi:hypothetical protein